MAKIKYGIYGGKTFGGNYATVNKYFKKKIHVKEFLRKYKIKYPKRKLKIAYL